MPISVALLKYGYSNFSLTILEFCDINVLLTREKHYLDKYSPEYNILKTPGSPSQGPGRIFTAEHKKNISIGVKKISRSAQYISNKSLAQANGVSVEVTDLKTNTITSYHAIKAAARALGINRSLITHFISLKQEKPILDRYVFKKKN